MTQKTINALHIYILIIMSTGFMGHVLMVPILLSTSNRDSWLSVILSMIPLILWILILFYLYKKLLPDENILSVLKRKCPYPWMYMILSVSLGTYFFITAFITLKYTLFWAKGNYTLETPDYVIVLLFVLICFYSTKKGLLTISTMAFLVLPFVSILGFLVGIGNSSNKNYEQLFPLFENGYSPFFHGFIYSCAGLFEILFLLFLSPFIKDHLKVKWLLLVGLILVVLILGPLTGAISEFGPQEAAKMRNPAYEQWRLLKIGEHFTRLDFLSIFQWLSGAFIRISLSLFIAEKILSLKKKANLLLPSLYLLLFISVCFPLDARSFFYILQTYFFPISLGFQISFCTLFLFLIHSKGVQHEKSTK